MAKPEHRVRRVTSLTPDEAEHIGAWMHSTFWRDPLSQHIYAGDEEGARRCVSCSADRAVSRQWWPVSMIRAAKSQQLYVVDIDGQIAGILAYEPAEDESATPDAPMGDEEWRDKVVERAGEAGGRVSDRLKEVPGPYAAALTACRHWR